jgi:taurine dioxygenase
MIRVERLSSDLDFGCVVHDITPEDIADEATRDVLNEAWITHGLIVFRNDNRVTTELQVELSKVFGPLERHYQEERLIDGHPELVRFAADPIKDPTVSVNGESLVGFIPWHGDFRWMAQPNHGGILRVHIQPASGGDTGFIDMIWAYETLPERLKQRIEGVEVVYQLKVDDETMYRFYPRAKIRNIVAGTSIELLRARAATDFPPIAQPLVYTQRETGRKVLNFSPLPAQYVLDMDSEEGFALLEEIAFHITDESRAYFHKWNPTDMVLWDNLRILHQACGVPPGDQREVWRTTIAAPYPLGRNLTEGGWNWKGATNAAS